MHRTITIKRSNREELDLIAERFGGGTIERPGKICGPWVLTLILVSDEEYGRFAADMDGDFHVDEWEDWNVSRR